jgi:Uma2 family endonuclease
MNPITTGAGTAAEELPDIEVPDGYEWIDGELVEKRGGMEASVVAVSLLALLGNHVKEHALGFVVGGDCGYQIFAARRKHVRKPDGSFVAKSRLPGGKPFRGNARVPPDLAIEVVSPNDLAEEVNQKVVEFLSAGVRLLWVVYPGTRTIHVFRRGGGAAWLTVSDELSGEDVVAGFSCRVGEVFADI